MKTMNKKQGFGLFFIGIASMVAIIANNMPKSYGWIMIGMAILLFAAGISIFFKYRK